MKYFKNKIGLFGSAFDPITLGHLDIINYILNENLVDQIWLVPTYDNTFGKKMIDIEHRINMCKLIENEKVKLFNYEYENKITGGTYNFLINLLDNNEYNKNDYYYIIGSDNVNSFSKWKNSDEILKIMKFITIERIGIDIDKNIKWYLGNPNIFLKNKNNVRFVSSTMVRNYIKNDNLDLLENILDKKVKDYILVNNLYK